MLQNYLKIAYRTLLRYKAYTALNVLGLTLGLTCAILIYLMVSFHLSFDKFHSKADRVVRIVSYFNTPDGEFYTPGVPAPLGDAARTEIAPLEKVSMVYNEDNVTVALIENNVPTKKFKEDNGGLFFVEPDLFSILDLKILKGNVQDLTQPNVVFLTEKMAKKYYGDKDPIGKILRLDARLNVKIVGIVQDFPSNTDIKGSIIASYLTRDTYSPEWAKHMKMHWGGINSSTQCFALLKPNTNIEQVQKLTPAFMAKHYTSAEERKSRFLYIQPISNIHFNENYNGMPKSIITTLAIIGLLLLITACINFINMATAQALKRSKEVGVRKVMGSSRGQLFWQFIAETAIITILAGLISYLLATMLFPLLSNWQEGIIGYRMIFSELIDLRFGVIFTFTIVLVIFISGSYPGFVLSGFNPVVALKGKISTQSLGGVSIRKALVVTQFVITQMLIIGTIVVSSQMNYFITSEMGFKHDAILQMPVPQQDATKLQTLKTQFKEIPSIEKVTYIWTPPMSQSHNTTNVKYDNRQTDEKFSLNTKFADEDYVGLYGIKIVAGRNIAHIDTMRETLVNEELVKRLGEKSNDKVLNKILEFNGRKITIVGVVKDYHVETLHSKIPPLAITSTTNMYHTVAVKMNMADAQNTIKKLDKIWSATFPDFVFEYEFYDEAIGKMYQIETAMLDLIQAFALIAILIGCLGLYGLVSFMVAQKTKEVGVRKVLGASVGQILWLFGKEFSILIIIAFIIAAPLAWWVLNGWLQDFQYRIDIGVGIFIMAVLLTGLIAAITVGWQSSRAALANPVKSLRTE
ncbi:ABC-type antimicrobial peptide transport system permease subunit [Arcicella aurantiaca]|uniref:ABC-type antimicrobial peptide transport system permease subunit n=2 Tax=Arcicella aurantiaca TaxID=591202 RepID=A0A316E9Z7_9BACT|nr:ABC-type antimicrobial peptide transport system permease subunit [Arcicella aurantiaca]